MGIIGDRMTKEKKLTYNYDVLSWTDAIKFKKPLKLLKVPYHKKETRLKKPNACRNIAQIKKNRKRLASIHHSW